MTIKQEIQQRGYLFELKIRRNKSLKVERALKNILNSDGYYWRDTQTHQLTKVNELGVVESVSTAVIELNSPRVDPEIAQEMDKWTGQDAGEIKRQIAVEVADMILCPKCGFRLGG